MEIKNGSFYLGGSLKIIKNKIYPKLIVKNQINVDLKIDKKINLDLKTDIDILNKNLRLKSKGKILNFGHIELDSVSNFNINQFLGNRKDTPY